MAGIFKRPSTGDREYGDDYGQKSGLPLNNDLYYPTESEMKTRMRENVMQSDDRATETGISQTGVINKSQEAEEHLSKPTFEDEIALFMKISRAKNCSSSNLNCNSFLCSGLSKNSSKNTFN